MAREPFRPDFLFSNIIDVHFGGFWLALDGFVPFGIPVDPNDQVYEIDYDGWNPSATGMTSIMLCNGLGEGQGTIPINGQAPSGEQLQQNILVYRPYISGGGSVQSWILVNLDLLTSNFTNPTLQVDWSLKYRPTTHDPTLTTSGLNPIIYENPKVTQQGIDGRPVSAVAASEALIYTGSDLLLKYRVFCDLTAKDRGWVNALSLQHLFP